MTGPSSGGRVGHKPAGAVETGCCGAVLAVGGGGAGGERALGQRPAALSAGPGGGRLVAVGCPGGC